MQKTWCDNGIGTMLAVRAPCPLMVACPLNICRSINLGKDQVTKVTCLVFIPASLFGLLLCKGLVSLFFIQ